MKTNKQYSDSARIIAIAGIALIIILISIIISQ